MLTPYGDAAGHTSASMSPMQTAEHGWWQRNRSSLYDVESPEFKERQAFWLWVLAPIVVAAFAFRVAGMDWPLSFVPALLFGAVGWVGFQARQRHRRRRL